MSEHNFSEDFRKHPPAPLAPRPLNLPQTFETVFDNGLRLVVVEDHKLPLVSFRLAFRTGDAHDPPHLPGLNEIMTGMLTEGTETRTSRQIADEVARIGAHLHAGSHADYTVVSASALAPHLETLLDLLSDVVLHPSFPEDELELHKQNTLQGLIAQRGQASFLANERIARAIYGEHPYAIVAPTPESVEAVTRETLADFHRRTFVPNNAVLFVAGDVETERILARMREIFGNWRKGEIPNAQFPALPARARREMFVVDRPGSAQTNIVIANAGLKRTHEDYFSTLVMHTILGGTASARLFMNLREAKGYTYGAYSSFDARREAGSFRVSSEVRAPVTGDALKEFFYELSRIRDTEVSDEELKNAKSYLTGVFPLRLETQDGLIDQLLQMSMYDLPADYLHTYRERVRSVTKRDVQRVAQSIIAPERAAIVVVGDFSSIQEQIKPYADDIKLYDSAGNVKA
jgi:zinc protease